MSRSSPSERLTRAKIVAAVTELLEHGGVDAVSTRTIGEALDVHPTALYRHFRDMDELLREAADGILAGLADGIRDPADGRDGRDGRGGRYERDGKGGRGRARGRPRCGGRVVPSAACGPDVASRGRPRDGVGPVPDAERARLHREDARPALRDGAAGR